MSSVEDIGTQILKKNKNTYIQKYIYKYSKTHSKTLKTVLHKLEPKCFSRRLYLHSKSISVMATLC